jgi:hypothetical protein
LKWVLREWDLSGGTRAAVTNELQSRGVELPPAPPPYQLPPCQRCGGSDVVAQWQQDKTGERRIRAECTSCHGFLRFLPQIEPYLSQADARASAARPEEVLADLRRRGLLVASDGGECWFADFQSASADDRALLREFSHSIAVLIGDTRGMPPARPEAETAGGAR